MNWIVAPNPGRSLADVLPAARAAVGGADTALGFPPCRAIAVLLVDGLGWTLLDEHASEAPFLASLADGQPLTAGFPTTTATSLTTLGTGRCAGAHGIVGYTFAEPSGTLFRPLSWSTTGPPHERRSLLGSWPPETAQPEQTVLEQAATDGVDVRLVVPRDFRDTGLTRAAFRGAQFHGVNAFGDLASGVLDALAGSGPALCYAYHGDLDLLGHIHGPGSTPWRFQLRQIDGLVEMIAGRLPPSTALVVVADHGMVELDPGAALDADTEPALQAGVRLIGGEVRSRHVYTEDGARADVLAAWETAVGERGLVLTREQAIDEGWFGPSVPADVRDRIGDVLVVMRDSGIVRSVAEPMESSLRGHHGSLTAAEQLVPALVVTG